MYSEDEIKDYMEGKTEAVSGLVDELNELPSDQIEVDFYNNPTVSNLDQAKDHIKSRFVDYINNNTQLNLREDYLVFGDFKGSTDLKFNPTPEGTQTHFHGNLLVKSPNTGEKESITVFVDNTEDGDFPVQLDTLAFNNMRPSQY